MMCTSFFDLTMENSTVEEEIADLDIEAPISVTVCFDEDFDEIPIKKEIVSDDYQTQEQKSQEIDNSAFVPVLEPGEKTIKAEIVTDDYQKETQKRQEIDNSAFVPILEPKKEIQDETFVPDLTEELNQYIQNIVSPHKTGILQDKVTNSNASNKRKKLSLQKHNQTKRGKNGECDSENKNNSEINENSCENISKNTSDIAALVATSCNPNSVLQNTAPTASWPDVNGLHKSELSKLNTHARKCLALVSENLRGIMKAYDYHKQHKTTEESFKNIKYNYFKSSYKTVVDILLPEEQNTEFIQSFLNDTLQRARKVSGPYYNRTFTDFANLVFEMFMWAKRQQQISEAARNSKNKNINVVVNNLSICSKADKVCIFSSGPPEREMSINVDPVISKYFQNTAPTTVQSSPNTRENEPQKSKNNTEQLNSPADPLAKFVAKYGNNNSKILQKPISTPQISSPSTVAHYRQKPAQSPNTTADLTHHPNLTYLLQKPSFPPFSGVSQSQPLQQQQESQRPPPAYGQYLQARVESAQPINQNDYMRYLQTQVTPQKQISMQYSQAQLRQPHQMQAQSGSVQQIQTHMAQTQQMPQYGVSMNYQTPLNQHQMPPYKQTKPPQVRPSQQYTQQQQLQQHQLIQQQQQTERGPHMASLLSSTIPPPLPSFNGQFSNFTTWEHSQSQSGQWKQQNNQPQYTQPLQIQPNPAKQTEWHQELNVIYQVGQAPQLQAQKGSPRTASTDSGFISPLNFNGITEQTVPTLPGESESIIPVITHVTSLNDKASFVESGTCAVCKKSTKQVCMGCMKIYYCTYQCQSQDWMAHAQFCTVQQTTSFDGALQS